MALFLLGFVTPRFAGIYADNIDKLPWASRLLMQWGGFVEAHAFNAGLADSIHLLVTTLDLMGGGRDKAAALRESLRVNTMPVVITSVPRIRICCQIGPTDGLVNCGR